MRRLATFAAALIASAVPALAQDTYSFNAEGTNLDGSPYRGTAVITYISDSTCIIEWTTGAATSQGICMRNGPAFAAAYTLQGATGLIVYQILDDGTLDGIWTIAGLNGAGTEVLTPQ
jgi:hypothetical protein